MGSSKFVAYRSTALLALAAAVGAGVPFRDEAGHEYHPMPGAKKPGRAHRNGTFTRGSRKSRETHAFMQAQVGNGAVGCDSLRRRAARWSRFHKATPIGGAS